MMTDLIRRQIFDAEAEAFGVIKKPVKRTEELIKKAKFIDKTYVPKANEY